MSSAIRVFLGVVAAAVLAAVLGAAFIVQQTQHALVLRFGQVVRTISEPGLYFKLPFIDNVLSIDKRIMDLERSAIEVRDLAQKQLVVDSFVRYRVNDPLRFYQAVNSIAGANARIGPIVDSAVRGVLADATFEAIVRTNRAGLMQRIREDVIQQSNGFGVQIIDLRLRRVDLPDQNSEAVFQRMKTERQQEAASLRAQGEEQALTIRARADRDVAEIRGNATRKSEEVRGAADAERNRIFAEAYGRDAEFFAFYRALEAYETALKAGDTRIILSLESDFFRYFGDPMGRRPAEAPPAPK